MSTKRIACYEKEEQVCRRLHLMILSLTEVMAYCIPTAHAAARSGSQINQPSLEVKGGSDAGVDLDQKHE